MSNLGKKSIYILSIGLLMFAYLNCGESFEEGSSDLSSLQACGADCLSQKAEHLELSIGEGPDIQIASDQRYFNVSGNCNEGNYSENVISWRLYRSGASVGYGTGARCENGRFYLVVDLTELNKGLYVNVSTRLVHTLDIEIKGVERNGDEVENVSRAKKSVTLMPN